MTGGRRRKKRVNGGGGVGTFDRALRGSAADTVRWVCVDTPISGEDIEGFAARHLPPLLQRIDVVRPDSPATKVLVEPHKWQPSSRISTAIARAPVDILLDRTFLQENNASSPLQVISCEGSGRAQRCRDSSADVAGRDASGGYEVGEVSLPGPHELLDPAAALDESAAALVVENSALYIALTDELYRMLGLAGLRHAHSGALTHLVCLSLPPTNATARTALGAPSPQTWTVTEEKAREQLKLSRVAPLRMVFVRNDGEEVKFSLTSDVEGVEIRRLQAHSWLARGGKLSFMSRVDWLMASLCKGARVTAAALDDEAEAVRAVVDFVGSIVHGVIEGDDDDEGEAAPDEAPAVATVSRMQAELLPREALLDAMRHGVRAILTAPGTSGDEDRRVASTPTPSWIILALSCPQHASLLNTCRTTSSAAIGGAIVVMTPTRTAVLSIHDQHPSSPRSFSSSLPC